jgi:hypothetical protein
MKSGSTNEALTCLLKAIISSIARDSDASRMYSSQAGRNRPSSGERREPEVHKLVVEVQHLLKPRSAYRTPLLMARLLLESLRR